MSTTYPTLPYTTFPNSIQTFDTKVNMVSSDGSKVKGFQDCLARGDISGAQAYYNQIPNAANKILTANDFNKLFQTCEALQRFYQSDVEDYIDDKQDEWEEILSEFTYKGTYNPTTQYEITNWVTYTVQGLTQLYICIDTPPVGTAPTNTTYWRTFTVQGEQGVSGNGLSFLGEWQSQVSYYVDDCVSYQNALWICTTNNSNNAPVEGSSYWNLVYRSEPTIYPCQSNQPTSQNVGDLWFEVLT